MSLPHIKKAPTNSGTGARVIAEIAFCQFGRAPAVGLANAGYVAKNMTGNATAIASGWCEPKGNVTTPNPVIDFYDGATLHVRIVPTVIGAIEKRRGASTVLATSSPSIWAIDIEKLIEVKAFIHGSTGTAEVRLNGNSVVSVFGANTSSGGSSVFDQVRWSHGSSGDFSEWSRFVLMDGNGSGSPEEWPFDDFLGERKVVELTPTADTSTRNFVPSSAASLTENYPMVDESAVDDDTT